MLVYFVYHLPSTLRNSELANLHYLNWMRKRLGYSKCELVLRRKKEITWFFSLRLNASHLPLILMCVIIISREEKIEDKRKHIRNDNKKIHLSLSNLWLSGLSLFYLFTKCHYRWVCWRNQKVSIGMSACNLSYCNLNIENYCNLILSSSCRIVFERN